MNHQKDNFKLALHPHHVASPSPLPFLVSISAFATALSATLYLNNRYFGGVFLLLSLIVLIMFLFLWAKQIIVEASIAGTQTVAVQKTLRLAFVLFLASEVAVFMSLFWVFFYASLDPLIEIGCIWPPDGLIVFNPLSIPLLNTIILLNSGGTVTVAHQRLREGRLFGFCSWMDITLFLGLFFIVLQLLEYNTAPFAIDDAIYGSIFFSITGLHGLHVIIGICFLYFCQRRIKYAPIANEDYLAIEFAIWYWHFVDVVWLFVYTFIYIWGSI